jgi:hypothetical protein
MIIFMNALIIYSFYVEYSYSEYNTDFFRKEQFIIIIILLFLLRD